MYLGLSDAASTEIRISGDPVPDSKVASLQALLGDILQVAYLPKSWEDVGFFGLAPCPTRIITEQMVPGGAPTAVGSEPDCSVEVKELKDGDAIQGAWSVDGIDVLPRVQHGAEPPREIKIRLRLDPDHRLALRARPAEYSVGDRMNEPWDFFEPTAFHELLTEVFRVPFERADDYSIRGYDTEYAGVRVFHGRIRSSERVTQLREDKSRSRLHWWDGMSLLVTDSDPQYLCLWIGLGEMDQAP